jgi:hypothetical protein
VAGDHRGKPPELNRRPEQLHKPGAHEKASAPQALELGLQETAHIKFLQPQMEFFNTVGPMVSSHWNHRVSLILLERYLSPGVAIGIGFREGMRMAEFSIPIPIAIPTRDTYKN